MTSKPLVRRTFATLRNAEFGFFGVVVYTRVQTPRFCGLRFSAGTLLFDTGATRPLRTSWLIVGILFFRSLVAHSPLCCLVASFRRLPLRYRDGLNAADSS